MKKAILLLSCILLAVGIVSAQDDKNGAKITITETEFDFGTFKEADGAVSHTFTIKNVGTAPLVITRVNASCGCTKPEYSTEPIAPGKETTLKITYNPAGRPGQFVKTIAIYSNGMDGALTIRVKGIVE